MTWELIGHKWATDLLARQVANGTARHAYLIVGPRGVGRRTLALWLAAALNCRERDASGYPCGTCHSCTRIRNLMHPDITLVESEQEGRQLRVEQMRDMQHVLALSPYEADYRVAILHRFEEANQSASNALLKMLEEPPPKVVIVLTASSIDQLLPTITSRCEVIRLRPLPLPLLAESLEGQLSIARGEAEQLAAIAGGRPGYAIRLSSQSAEAKNRSSWLEDLLVLLVSNRAKRFSYARKLAQKKDRSIAREELMVWISFWRDVLLKSAGAEVFITNLDYGDQIDQLAHAFAYQKVYQFVAALEHSVELISRNANLRLVLDVMMLDLPFLRADFFQTAAAPAQD